MKLTTKIYAVVIIVYIVGVVGLSVPQTRELFIALSALNIILAIGLLLYFHFKLATASTPTFIAKAITVAVAGFLLEVAGVKTGVIFGDYTYGTGLGIKLLDVPLLIGINWFFMVYCSTQLACKFKLQLIPTALISGLLMTAYDVVLESNAIALGYWQWAGNTIPLQNYLAWFGFGSIFSLFFMAKSTRVVNPMAVFLFAIQLAFFALLILFRS